MDECDGMTHELVPTSDWEVVDDLGEGIPPTHERRSTKCVNCEEAFEEKRPIESSG